MIVIADASPINYLALIGHIQILPEQFGKEVIPQAVQEELESQGAPEEVRKLLADKPDWLLVQRVDTIDASLARLDAGEREAIALAQELNADLVILDDRKGRQTAMEIGLSVIGTLGLIEQAAMLGLIDLPTAIARLKQTTFRISPHLLDALLDRHKQSKTD